jgi:hypothetical protein
MTVWIVEHECDDRYYSPYLEAIFLTEELAKAYVASRDEFDRVKLEISKYEVREKV